MPDGIKNLFADERKARELQMRENEKSLYQAITPSVPKETPIAAPPQATFPSMHVETPKETQKLPTVLSDEEIMRQRVEEKYKRAKNPNINKESLNTQQTQQSTYVPQWRSMYDINKPTTSQKPQEQPIDFLKTQEQPIDFSKTQEERRREIFQKIQNFNHAAHPIPKSFTLENDFSKTQIEPIDLLKTQQERRWEEAQKTGDLNTLLPPIPKSFTLEKIEPIRKELNPVLDKKIEEYDKLQPSFKSWLFETENIHPLAKNLEEKIGYEAKSRLYEENRLNYRAAQNLLIDAKNTLNAPTKEEGGGFMSGLGQEVKQLDTWVTLIGLSDNLRKSIVVKLGQSGKPLLKSEEALLDAIFNYYYISNARAGNISNAYSGGQMAGKSIPFMVDFVMTGGFAAGTSTGLTKAMVRHIERKLITELGEEGYKKLTKIGFDRLITAPIKLAGELTTGAKQAVISPTFYTGVLEETMAKPVEKKEGGGYVYMQGAPVKDAIVRGMTEFMFERSGGFIGDVLTPVGKLLKNTKYLYKISSTPIGKFNKLFYDGSGKFAKAIKLTGFSGLPTQIGEEVLEQTADYLMGVSTKEEMNEFFSKDNLQTMILGFLPMTVISGAGNVTSNVMSKVKVNYDHKQAIKNINKTFGEDAPQIIMSIDNATPNQLSSLIDDVLLNNNGYVGNKITDKGKQMLGAIVGYAGSKVKVEAMNGVAQDEFKELASPREVLITEENGKHKVSLLDAKGEPYVEKSFDDLEAAEKYKGTLEQMYLTTNNEVDNKINEQLHEVSKNTLNGLTVLKANNKNTNGEDVIISATINGISDDVLGVSNGTTVYVKANNGQQSIVNYVENKELKRAVIPNEFLIEQEETTLADVFTQQMKVAAETIHKTVAQGNQIIMEQLASEENETVNDYSTKKAGHKIKYNGKEATIIQTTMDNDKNKYADIETEDGEVIKGVLLRSVKNPKTATFTVGKKKVEFTKSVETGHLQSELYSQSEAETVKNSISVTPENTVEIKKQKNPTNPSEVGYRVVVRKKTDAELQNEKEKLSILDNLKEEVKNYGLYLRSGEKILRVDAEILSMNDDGTFNIIIKDANTQWRMENITIENQSKLRAEYENKPEIQEQTETQQEQSPTEQSKYPLTKDGEIDYSQIEDVNVYADALREEFPNEEVQIIDGLISEQNEILNKSAKLSVIEKRRVAKKVQLELDKLNKVKELFKTQDNNIKEGVQKLFESNPELANAVSGAADVNTNKESLEANINTQIEAQNINTELTEDLNNLTPEQELVYAERELGVEQTMQEASATIKAISKQIEAAEKKKDKKTTIKDRVAVQKEINELKAKSKIYSSYILKNTKAPEVKSKEVKKEAPKVNILDKWNKAKKIKGNKTAVTLVNGKRIKGNYYLVEAEAPTASHNPNKNFQKSEDFPVDENGKTINDRDYEHDKAAQNQVIDKGNRYDSRALENIVIVSPEGLVLSGNDRIMSGQLAAVQGTDKEYLDFLNGYSENYGFTQEQISEYKHPRVVFVVSESIPLTTEYFAMFNADDKKSQNKTEKAVKVGKTISEETVLRIARIFNRYDKLTEVYNSPAATSDILDVLLNDKIIQPNEVSALLSHDGTLFSGQGRDMVESLIIGSVLTEDAVRIVNSKNSLKQAILTAIVPLLQNAKMGEMYSLKEEIDLAIKLSYESSKVEMTIQQYMSQTVIEGFIEDPNDIYAITVVRVAEQLSSEKYADFRKFILSYNEIAYAYSQGQVDVFTNRVLTKEEIIEQLLNLNSHEQKQNSTEQVRPDDTSKGKSKNRRGEKQEASVDRSTQERGDDRGTDTESSKQPVETPTSKKSNQSDIERIISEAKESNTYLKAPNGKPTKLNENQWVQVRTKAFKDWFGDWENANKPYREVFQERHVAFQDLKDDGLRRAKFNSSDGSITVYHGTSKDAEGKIFNNGFNDSMYFSINKNGTTNGDSPLDVAKRKFGKDATVMEIKIDPRYIELAAAGSELYSPYRLVKGEDGVYSKEVNASKVIDENGEPLVVYHGSPNGNFSIFKSLTQFTKNKLYADRYQNQGASSISYKKEKSEPETYETYLSLKNPFDTRNPEHEAIFYEYESFYSPNLTERGLVDWMEGENLAEWLQENYPEFDGILLDEGSEPKSFIDELNKQYESVDDYLGWRGISYMVFSPTQIKSATGNNGEFSESSDDIRFSIKSPIGFYSTVENALDKIQLSNLTSQERVARVQEAIEQINDGKVVEYVDDMNAYLLEAYANNQEVLDRLAELQQIGCITGGITQGDTIVINTNRATISDCLSTFEHERQHIEVRINPLWQQIKQDIIQNVNAKKLDDAVAILSRTDFYRGVPVDELADEYIAYIIQHVFENKIINTNLEYQKIIEDEYRRQNSNRFSGIDEWGTRTDNPTTESGGQLTINYEAERDRFLGSTQIGAEEQKIRDRDTATTPLFQAVGGESTSINTTVGELSTNTNIDNASQSSNVRASYIGKYLEIKKALSGKNTNIIEAYQNVLQFIEALANDKTWSKWDKTAIPQLKSIRDSVRELKKAGALFSIRKKLDMAMELVLQRQYTTAEHIINKFAKLKLEGTTTKGVKTQKKVDTSTQIFFTTLKSALSKDQETSVIAERIADLNIKLSETTDQATKDNFEAQIRALTLLHQHKAEQNRLGLNVNTIASEIDDISKEFALRDNRKEIMTAYKKISANNKKLDNATEREKVDIFEENIKLKDKITKLQSERNAIKGDIKHDKRNKAKLPILKEMLLNARLSQQNEMEWFIKELDGILREGIRAKRAFVAKEKAHKEQIIEEALRAIDYTTDKSFMNPNKKENRKTLWSKFIHSIDSFASMLKMLDVNAPDGRGLLFTRFFTNGIMEASKTEQLELKASTLKLDKKIQEIFGKGFHLTQLQKLCKQTNGAVVTLKSPKEVKNIESGERDITYNEEERALDNGQALYIYAIAKMPDGLIKLNAMGIDQEQIDAVADTLSDELKQYQDWVQEEFLPELRVKYNETHIQLFGTQLDQIENYFKLNISRGDLQQETQIEDSAGYYGLPKTDTGSILKRVYNKNAIDIENSNAIETLIEHLHKMEHWNAYAPTIKDLNTLNSNPAFKKHINRYIYNGAAEDFKTASQIAVGAYVPKGRGGIEDAIVASMKLYAVGKISLRLNTALKQSLALIQVLGYGDMALVRHSFRAAVNPLSIKWCMLSIPDFEKRWKDRAGGDSNLMISGDMDGTAFEKLHTRISDLASKGMLPNAAVDLWSCAIIAKGMYDTQLSYYKSRDYGEEESIDLALKDAEIAYNETMQSAEAGYLAAIQKDKTWWSATFSLFNNSSIAYQRLLIEGLKGIGKQLSPKQRADMIAFQKAKYLGLGRSVADADKFAKSDVNKALRKNIMQVAMNGYIVELVWNLGSSIGLMKAVQYLITFSGDDDDTKNRALEELKDDLKKSALKSFTTPVRGLPSGKELESMVELYLNGWNIRQINIESNPLISDTKDFTINMSEGFKNNDWVRILNGLVRYGVGFAGLDLNTLANISYGIFDIIENHENITTTDVIYDLSLLLNAPYSEQKFLNVSLREGDTYQDIMQRYISLKRVHKYGVFTPLTNVEDKRATQDVSKMVNVQYYTLRDMLREYEKIADKYNEKNKDNIISIYDNQTFSDANSLMNSLEYDAKNSVLSSDQLNEIRKAIKTLENDESLDKMYKDMNIFLWKSSTEEPNETEM